MLDLPYHDESALIVSAAVGNGRLQPVNPIIELARIKPKALINDTAGVLDEDHVWITRMAHIRSEQLQYLQAHA
jgi:hypothetical protein